MPAAHAVHAPRAAHRAPRALHAAHAPAARAVAPRVITRARKTARRQKPAAARRQAHVLAVAKRQKAALVAREQHVVGQIKAAHAAGVKPPGHGQPLADILAQMAAAQDARAAEADDAAEQDAAARAAISDYARQQGLGVGAFANDAMNLAQAGQMLAGHAGAHDAQDLLGATTAPLNPYGVVGSFNQIPTDALQALIGRASNGQPLADLFASFGPEAQARVERTLQTALLTGLNPQVVAQQVASDLQVSLQRAEMISRTEMLGAYRDAAMQTYRANSDLVGQWMWIAAQQASTCAACIFMDGSIWPMDEDMDTHVACRCTQLPLTNSYADILAANGLDVAGMDIPDSAFDPESRLSGADWFAAQSAEVQQSILGSRAAYESYKAGEVGLGDFVGIRHDPVWGDSVYQKSLRDALTPNIHPDVIEQIRTEGGAAADELAREFGLGMGRTEEAATDAVGVALRDASSLAADQERLAAELTPEGVNDAIIQQTKRRVADELAARLAGDADFAALREKLLDDVIARQENAEASAAVLAETRRTYSDAEAVRWLIGTWARGEGSMPVAMQLAARAEFGLADAHLAYSAEALAEARVEWGDVEGGLRAVLRAQYDETQAWFAERGITEVPIYRGFNWAEEPIIAGSPLGEVAGEYREITLPLQPLSSFSTSDAIAGQFAMYGMTPTDAGDYHLVIGAHVPVEQILATPQTGFGALGELEAVVLGGDHTMWAFAEVAPEPVSLYDEIKDYQLLHTPEGATPEEKWRVGMEYLSGVQFHISEAAEGLLARDWAEVDRVWPDGRVEAPPLGRVERTPLPKPELDAEALMAEHAPAMPAIEPPTGSRDELIARFADVHAQEAVARQRMFEAGARYGEGAPELNALFRQAADLGNEARATFHAIIDGVPPEDLGPLFERLQAAADDAKSAAFRAAEAAEREAAKAAEDELARQGYLVAGTTEQDWRGLEAMLGPGAPGRLPDITGAGVGDTLTVHYAPDLLTIERHSVDEGVDELLAKFQIARHEDGTLVLYADFVASTEKTFASGRDVVDGFQSLRDMGVSRIELTTGGSLGSDLNGYYTWARAGAEGDIPPGVLDAARARFGADVTRVEQVMDAPGGAAWWKQNGHSFRATMDLSPGGRTAKWLEDVQARLAAREAAERAAGEAAADLGDIRPFAARPVPPEVQLARLRTPAAVDQWLGERLGGAEVRLSTPSRFTGEAVPLRDMRTIARSIAGVAEAVPDAFRNLEFVGFVNDVTDEQLARWGITQADLQGNVFGMADRQGRFLLLSPGFRYPEQLLADLERAISLGYIGAATPSADWVVAHEMAHTVQGYIDRDIPFAERRAYAAWMQEPATGSLLSARARDSADERFAETFAAMLYGSPEVRASAEVQAFREMLSETLGRDITELAGRPAMTSLERAQADLKAAKADLAAAARDRKAAEREVEKIEAAQRKVTEAEARVRETREAMFINAGDVDDMSGMGRFAEAARARGELGEEQRALARAAGTKLPPGMEGRTREEYLAGRGSVTDRRGRTTTIEPGEAAGHAAKFDAAAERRIAADADKLADLRATEAQAQRAVDRAQAAVTQAKAEARAAERLAQQRQANAAWAAADKAKGGSGYRVSFYGKGARKELKELLSADAQARLADKLGAELGDRIAIALDEETGVVTVVRLGVGDVRTELEYASLARARDALGLATEPKAAEGGVKSLATLKREEKAAQQAFARATAARETAEEEQHDILRQIMVDLRDGRLAEGSDAYLARKAELDAAEAEVGRLGLVEARAQREANAAWGRLDQAKGGTGYRIIEESPGALKAMDAMLGDGASARLAEITGADLGDTIHVGHDVGPSGEQLVVSRIGAGKAEAQFTFTRLNSRAARAAGLQTGDIVLRVPKVRSAEKVAGGGSDILDGAQALREMGVSRITATAAGQLGGGYNGYYTWAVMGAEGALPPEVDRVALRSFLDRIGYEGPAITRVEEVLDLPGGRAWWKANGSGFEATLDLSPGGRTAKWLDDMQARLAAREARQAEARAAEDLRPMATRPDGSTVPARRAYEAVPDVRGVESQLEDRHEGLDVFLGAVDDGAANRVAATFDAIAERWPEMADRVGYLGLDFGPEAERAAGGIPQLPPRYLAGADVNGRYLLLNGAAWADPAELERVIARAVADGFHPAGADSVEFVVAHELGHVMEAWIRTDPARAAALDAFLADHAGVTTLGEAAKLAPEEAFATAFAAHELGILGDDAYVRAQSDFLATLLEDHPGTGDAVPFPGRGSDRPRPMAGEAAGGLPPDATAAQAQAWLKERLPNAGVQIVADEYGPGLGDEAARAVAGSLGTLAEYLPDAAGRMQQVYAAGELGMYHPSMLAQVEGGRILGLNVDRLGDLAAAERHLRELVASGWLTAADASFSGMVAHEFGHVVEGWLSSVGARAEVAEWVSRFGDAAGRLSNYAASKPGEAFAEAFATLVYGTAADARNPAVQGLAQLLTDHGIDVDGLRAAVGAEPLDFRAAGDIRPMAAPDEGAPKLGVPPDVTWADLDPATREPWTGPEGVRENTFTISGTDGTEYFGKMDDVGSEQERQLAAQDIYRLIGLGDSIVAGTALDADTTLFRRVAGVSLGEMSEAEARAAVHAGMTEAEAWQFQMGAWLMADGDRHMGNYMVTAEGRVVAIDLGLAFWLPNPPGSTFAETVAWWYDVNGERLLDLPIPRAALDAMVAHADELARAFPADVPSALSTPERDRAAYQWRLRILRQLAAMESPTYADWVRLTEGG